MMTDVLKEQKETPQDEAADEAIKREISTKHFDI